jgi:hypothetical protein
MPVLASYNPHYFIPYCLGNRINKVLELVVSFMFGLGFCFLVSIFKIIIPGDNGQQVTMMET